MKSNWDHHAHYCNHCCCSTSNVAGTRAGSEGDGYEKVGIGGGVAVECLLLLERRKLVRVAFY